MYVTLRDPISPIKEMGEFDLPNFSVLVGRNGVGKTRLLKAIANGSVTVSGVSPSDIEEYDINSFQPNDSGRGGWGHASFFHATDRSFFFPTSGRSLVEIAEDVFKKTLNEFGLHDAGERFKFEDDVRMAVRKTPDFGTLGPIKGDGPVAFYVNAIGADVFGKMVSQNNREEQVGSFNNSQAALVSQAMKLNGKLPHELHREDILRASHYEGNTIGNQLSQIFARYKAEQYAWSHTASERSDKSVQRLMEEYREANRPPWETLGGCLGRMREASEDPELFNFEFSDPEEDTLSYTDHNQYSFETRFTNRTTGDSYSVKELSSGEKILLCLCLSAFNRDMGRRQPGLLLLDELDAVLHPSMISALIAGLKDQFVGNGTRVIMATHSVTTVSLLNEGEIFRVVRSGNRVDVRSVTRAEAVAELSEGLATIETGLRIATSDSAAPITILTEGNNVLHLKRWAALFFGRQVEVFDKLPNRTGKNELSSYGRLLARMNATSHFLIVWDCDARKEAERLREELSGLEGVTAFAFEKRENQIAPKGIENNYDDIYFKEYVTRSRRVATGESSVTMSGPDKNDFARHVFENGTEDYFRHFGHLRDVVHGILNGRNVSESPSV